MEPEPQNRARLEIRASALKWLPCINNTTSLNVYKIYGRKYRRMRKQNVHQFDQIECT